MGNSGLIIPNEVLKIFFATVTFTYVLADDLFGMVVMMVLLVFILLWNFGFSSSVLLKSFGMLHFGSFLDILESIFLLGLKNLSFSSGVLLKSDPLFVVAVRLVGLSDNLGNLLDVVAVGSGSGSNLLVVVTVGSGSEVRQRGGNIHRNSDHEFVLGINVRKGFDGLNFEEITIVTEVHWGDSTKKTAVTVLNLTIFKISKFLEHIVTVISAILTNIAEFLESKDLLFSFSMSNKSSLVFSHSTVFDPFSLSDSLFGLKFSQFLFSCGVILKRVEVHKLLLTLQEFSLSLSLLLLPFEDLLFSCGVILNGDEVHWSDSAEHTVLYALDFTVFEISEMLHV